MKPAAVFYCPGCLLEERIVDADLRFRVMRQGLNLESSGKKPITGAGGPAGRRPDRSKTSDFPDAWASALMSCKS
jgi:hypothetical protein